MSERWQLTIDIWPFSTGRGRDVDYSEIGGEDARHLYFNAVDFREALKLADAAVIGVKTNPKIWQVIIRALQNIPDRSFP